MTGWKKPRWQGAASLTGPSSKPLPPTEAEVVATPEPLPPAEAEATPTPEPLPPAEGLAQSSDPGPAPDAPSENASPNDPAQTTETE